MFPVMFRNGLMAPDDIAASARNILASELWFRVSILGDIICQVAFAVLGVVLYGLFRDTHREVARVLVGLVLAAVPIAMLNSLNHVAALLMLRRNDTNQAMFFFELSKNGILIVDVLWGLWLFPFGWLALKSGFIPKILGILLMIGCFGYLAVSAVGLVFPAYQRFVEPVVYLSGIAELAMVAWLLVFGIKGQSKIATSSAI